MTLLWAAMYGIPIHVIRRFRITCSQLFRRKNNFSRFMLNVGTYIPDLTASHHENGHFSRYHLEKAQNPKFYPKPVTKAERGSRCIVLLFL